MKKSIQAIIIIVTMVIVAIAFYRLGSMHVKALPEPQKEESTITSDSIPLDDIACYYINANGYICLELKDSKYISDNPQNKSYMEVLQGKEDITQEFCNNKE